MSATMKHKGYQGLVEYSDEDRVFHGKVLGVDDLVTFEGTNVAQLEKAFHEAVDDYLDLCEKLGRNPDREYSGRIPLRIAATLHRRIALAASSEDKSVNNWIESTLEKLVAAPEAVVTGRLPARSVGRKVAANKSIVRDAKVRHGASARATRRKQA